MTARGRPCNFFKHKNLNK